MTRDKVKSFKLRINRIIKNLTNWYNDVNDSFYKGELKVADLLDIISYMLGKFEEASKSMRRSVVFDELFRQILIAYVNSYVLKYRDEISEIARMEISKIARELANKLGVLGHTSERPTEGD